MSTGLAIALTAVVMFFFTAWFCDFWKQIADQKLKMRTEIHNAVESDNHKRIRAVAVKFRPCIEKETFTFLISRCDHLEAQEAFPRETYSKLLTLVFNWQLFCAH